MEKNLESLVKRGKVLTEIGDLASRDSKFREALVKNPETTLKKYNSETNNFFEGKKIVVNTFQEDEINLVIPTKIEIDDFELSDTELETISGGTDLITGVVIGVVAIGGGWVASKVF